MGVDKARKCVMIGTADREGLPIAYDYLILATDAMHSYFGHNEFTEFAPGMKSLADECRPETKSCRPSKMPRLKKIRAANVSC